MIEFCVEVALSPEFSFEQERNYHNNNISIVILIISPYSALHIKWTYRGLKGCLLAIPFLVVYVRHFFFEHSFSSTNWREKLLAIFPPALIPLYFHHDSKQRVVPVYPQGAPKLMLWTGLLPWQQSSF